jgi:uncharacterized protein YegP (UPF0339 family)
MAKLKLKKKASGKGGLKIIIHQSLQNAQFYTTIRAGNNKIIFDGGEGYVRSESAYKSVLRLIEQLKDGNFEIIDNGHDKP